MDGTSAGLLNSPLSHFSNNIRLPAESSGLLPVDTLLSTIIAEFFSLKMGIGRHPRVSPVLLLVALRSTAAKRLRRPKCQTSVASATLVPAWHDMRLSKTLEQNTEPEKSR
jgi:hypothetical protein